MVIYVYQFRFNLKSLEEGYLPEFTGHLVRGAFMEMLKRHDPQVSSYLHRDNLRRPYSLSPLYMPKKLVLRQRRRQLKKDAGMSAEGSEVVPNDEGLSGYGRGVRVAIPSGFSTFFTLNLLMHGVAREVTHSLLEMPSGQLLLEDVPFVIHSIDYSRREIRTPYEESEWVVGDELTALLLPFTVDLKFKFPTQFSSREVPYPVVLPVVPQLFGNLVSLYEDFYPENSLRGWLEGRGYEMEDFFSGVKRWVYVVAHRISTKQVYWGKEVPFTGFLGWVRLKVESERLGVDFIKWVYTLLELGVYSHVGKNRTVGFGKYEIERAPWVERE